MVVYTDSVELVVGNTRAEDMYFGSVWDSNTEVDTARSVGYIDHSSWK
jgi:hypothetical protein